MKEIIIMLKLRIIRNNAYLNCLKRMLHDNNLIIYKDQNGKPFIKDSIYYFSVSHCNSKTAIVVSNHPVGIDMETIRDYNSKLLKYLNINKHLSKRAFFREWTRREAYIKKNNLNLGSISSLNLSDAKFITISLFKTIISICF
jgi:phosphopantetheinyl transferase